MDDKRKRHPQLSPAGVAAGAISSVLGDADLLREILLRLAFPTSLVRAAAVCKRWLRLASHPAFLHRFRDLHPPRLLGFYVFTRSVYWMQFEPVRPKQFVPVRPKQFVPMLPQPPELAAVLRRASFSLEDTYEGFSMGIMGCRNGSVLINLYREDRVEFTHGVHSPLYPERGLVIFAPPPFGSSHLEDDIGETFGKLLTKEGGGVLSYFWLLMGFNTKGKATAHVYMLQDGVWRMHSSATTQLPESRPGPNIVLADDKIYMVATVSNILVLDLTSSSFFTIELPNGVEYGDGDIMLSRADGSLVYLIHVKELQLRIWLRRGDSGSVGNWLLVDTICLREMCASLKVSNHMIESGHASFVKINEVGDNAEFVFLTMGECALYMDIKSREMHKVYEETEKDRHLIGIRPFMMMWPPIFSVLKD